MITSEQFEKGLRLDQYIASITDNKENFRANFVKAVEIFTDADLAFFRKLPYKVNIAVLTEDGNLHALRDVPVISRLSVEVGKLALRLFRPTTHAESAQELMACPSTVPSGESADAQQEQQAQQVADVASPAGTAESRPLPVIAFFDPDMQLLGAHAGPHADIANELRRRHAAWADAHPEIKDARETLVKMTPITRTRVIQALYALTPEQRLDWGRKTVGEWRRMLSQLSA